MATGRIWSESSSRWGWIMLKLSITSIIKFIRIRNHGHHANMVARQRSQMNQHDMPCILIGTLRPHSCGVCRCKGGQDAWDRMGWGRGKVVQPIIGRAIWPTYWCEVHAMSMCRYVYQKRLWQQRPTSLHSEIMDDRGTTSKGSLWCSICFRVPELSTWGFQLCEGLSEGQRDREHSTEFYKRFPVAKGSWRCWKVCSLHHPWNHHGITFFAEVKWCIFVWTFPLHKLSMVPAVEAATALRRQWGSLLLYHGYIRMQLAFFKLPCFFHPFTTRMLRSEIVGSGGRQTEKNVCKKGVDKPPLLRCHSRKSIGWYYMKYTWRCHEMFGNIMKYEKSMDISQISPPWVSTKKTTEWVGAVRLESWFLCWPFQTPITKDKFSVPSFF